jgi:photosystem II stability/assembly factor-like uncharacterized protein
MTEPVTILAGTTKGLFLLSSADRRRWALSGPHCGGWPINHAIGAPGGALWACGGGAFPGAGVWRSEDGGESWQLSKLADGQMDDWARSDPEAAKIFGMTPGEPAPFSGRIEALWSLGRAGTRLYAGAKPATLFASEDGGATWQPVESLTDHPSAGDWQPGAAGLTLHSIAVDPGAEGRLWLGISAAGVFASEDGGQSWERRNRLTNAGACSAAEHPAAPRGGETGLCVHNIARGGDWLYQQNHHGVFRSRDGGQNWEDITAGLPSPFGFPVAVHPGAPETLWVLPLNGDAAGRYPPEAAAAVWRSRDAGETWQACRAGLPQAGCYFTVLRQAMATDRASAPGLYFGTNSGSIFASLDEGDSWEEIARHLPTVLSVETVTG